MGNAEKTEICRKCGRKYIFVKSDKYHPFCSKKCFYDHIGHYMKSGGKDVPVFSAEHEMFCRFCGKKVDVLINGSFCCSKCESDFSQFYDDYLEEVKMKKREKFSFVVYCNLCGRRFGARSKRHRFCADCRDGREECKDKCFKMTDGFRTARRSGKMDMYDFIIQSRERGMSYAELQKEETLRMLKGDD